MTDTPDPIDVAVGARVRLRRRSLGISQSALADALGVSFQQVQKYERGTNRVSASSLVRVAATLHCSVAHLIGEEESDPGSLAANLTPDALQLLEAYAKVSAPRDRKAILDLAKALGRA